MNIVAKDAKTVELLARRARRLAEPLVDRIPGGSLSIEMCIDDKWLSVPWSVSIVVHRVLNAKTFNATLAPVVFQEGHLTSTGQVDEVIEKLRGIVEGQSWKLDKSELAPA